MLELYSKILSVLPFYYFIFLGTVNTFMIITHNIQLKQLFLYTIGIIFATLFSETIKKIKPPNNIFKNIWYRPYGAKGCDYLSIKGIAPDFTPGFPSGHMSTTSYFVIYNILAYKDSKPSVKRNTIIVLNLILLTLMGWARIYKKCHTIIQVIGGTILGGGIATLFYNLGTYITS